MHTQLLYTAGFSVPVVIKKLDGNKVKDIGQKKWKAFLEKFNVDGLGDHLKKSLPDVHVEGVFIEDGKISIGLIVRTTDQLLKVYEAAKQPAEQHNALSLSICEYSSSLFDGKLNKALHVQTVMTKKLLIEGMVELDDIDDETETARYCNYMINKSFAKQRIYICLKWIVSDMY